MWQNLEHPAITYAMRFGMDESTPVAHCEHCGNEIHYGDDGFYVEGDPYCNDCFFSEIYETAVEGETPTCWNCGKKIEDDYYRFYGDVFCEDCLKVRRIDD